jgi:hypothetical protein
VCRRSHRQQSLDLELAVGGLIHVFGEYFGRAIDRVERLREPGLQPPFHVRHRLGNGRSRDGGRCRTGGGGLQKLTTFHDTFLPQSGRDMGRDRLFGN